MGEVQVWGRGMCVGSLNCGESWFLVPLSSESSALAVYLKLPPLSHAQTEKNIIVVRGGVVAEEKEKCVWNGSVRHSISGRAGLGAWGSREQHNYVVCIVDMARMLQGIPWNWGWHLCYCVGLWYGRKIEVIEMLLENSDWAEGRGWMGMGMLGRNGCHRHTRLKVEQGLHTRCVSWGGGGRGLCKVGSAESCSRPARYQASPLPPRHRLSRIAWVRHGTLAP